MPSAGGGLHVAVHSGARVGLEYDSARRGVVESKSGRDYWAVRFADKICYFHVKDLVVLSPEDAFEPQAVESQAYGGYWIVRFAD
ncbi:hypothetical protein M885DRAFT_569961 [Pelagophyceae sp. CCMP2097]|nr:hypothetical protein M885DRAFT_569961 [Pelagophyceae sp. CCMP2097]